MWALLWEGWARTRPFHRVGVCRFHSPKASQKRLLDLCSESTDLEAGFLELSRGTELVGGGVGEDVSLRTMEIFI